MINRVENGDQADTSGAKHKTRHHKNGGKKCDVTATDQSGESTSSSSSAETKCHKNNKKQRNRKGKKHKAGSAGPSFTTTTTTDSILNQWPFKYRFDEIAQPETSLNAAPSPLERWLERYLKTATPVMTQTMPALNMNNFTEVSSHQGSSDVEANGSRDNMGDNSEPEGTSDHETDVQTGVPWPFNLLTESELSEALANDPDLFLTAGQSTHDIQDDPSRTFVSEGKDSIGSHESRDVLVNHERNSNSESKVYSSPVLYSLARWENDETSCCGSIVSRCRHRSNTS